MGSRIMHLIIANKIADSLAIKDKGSFLIGGIAPDAVPTKDISHFFKGEVQDYTRYIDYQGFLHTYRSHRESYYILGYFTHLIADDIWLQGFNLAWLKNRMEADEGLYKLYHHDFRLLNGKLLEYYGVKDELRSWLSIQTTIMDLQEVKASEVEQFIPSALGDMEYDQDELNESLHVFTFDQIVGYIETSVDKGLIHLKPILTLTTDLN